MNHFTISYFTGANNPADPATDSITSTSSKPSIKMIAFLRLMIKAWMGWSVNTSFVFVLTQGYA